MMACLGKMDATDLKTNPEVKSEVEHEEVPNEDTPVETGKAPNKRHRVWNLGAECSQKLKEETQGNCGSRKKLTIASRKMT
jgi:hypothetical protein